MPSFFDLQKYAATGIAAPDMTAFDKMRASTLMGGAVQTLTGIPPLTFKADGKPLISWSMKGNTQQTGTPSPDNIIIPTFCGVRTGNMFDINATPTKYSQSTVVTVDGQTLTITGSWYIYYEIDVVPNTDYYVKWTIDYAEIEGRGSIAILTTSGQTISQQSSSPFSFNSGENHRIRLCIYSASSTSATVRLSNIMLNTGSTALPYEPYGWKIPITCAGQTTPIYTGDPLRKALDGSDAVDVLSSAGTITREVDAEGNALATPTTQIVDVPEIPTVKGQNTLTVDSELQPSEMTITYRG